MHPAASFVHWYHEQLTLWFSGAGDRDSVWKALVDHTSGEMAIVFPSGKRWSGQRLLESMEDAFGTSPRFRASISDLEIVHVGENHAMVAYTEVQQGARRSAAYNERTALALLLRDGAAWTWRFVQETGKPESQPSA